MSTKLEIDQVFNREVAVTPLGITSSVEIAQSLDQLREAKALDDLAFGIHQGITIDELIEIKNHGAVLLLRDKKGTLIGESQVITSPIPQHKVLESNEAFNYGTAILPGLQNHGIAQILFKSQEIVALQAGKTKCKLTARLENAQSLRGRFKAGYKIVGYDPNYYGSFEQDGARVVMEKNLLENAVPIPPSILAQKVSNGDALAVNQENVDFAVTSEHQLIYFQIKGGDGVDYKGHQLVSRIFDANYHIGIGLLKPSEFDSSQNQYCLLMFKQK